MHGWRKILILVFVLYLPCLAQKWGKIPDEELSISLFTDAPEADAVYLFDIGKMTIQNDFSLEFERHYRIKVLTENGKEFANRSVVFYAEDSKITDLDAQAFSPDGTKHKLDDDTIFEQEYKGSDNWKKKTFAIPGVEVGSVIECKYRMVTEDLYLLPKWSFQNDAYTLRSEVSVNLLPGFTYTTFTTNMGSAVPQPSMEDILIPGPDLKKRTRYTWKMENIPALRSEPMVKGYEDYSSTLYFQLTTYNDEYQSINFTKTWDALIKSFIKYYSPFLSEKDKHRYLVNTVAPEAGTPIEKATNIYHYVQTEIEANEKPGLGKKEDPEVILEKKEARPVDKNLLLIYLLHHVDIQAFPVLICTRDEGTIKPQWISIYNFNHIIVEVNLDNKKYYLDAQDRYTPFGALPENCLVGQGLRVEEGNTQVINIPQPKIKNEQEISTEVQFFENKGLKCKTTCMFTGLAAADERYHLNKEDPAVYLKDKIKDRFSNAVVDTLEIQSPEASDEPLVYSIEYHVADFLQPSDPYLILPLPLYNQSKENPFVAEKRRLPIDFNYPIRTSETITIELPQGIQVVELPSTANARLPKISFSASCSQTANTISYSRNFNRLRMQCSASEYEDVKRLFKKMEEADQAKILLSSHEE